MRRATFPPRLRCALASAVLAALAPLSSAQDAPLQGFDAYVEQALKWAETVIGTATIKDYKGYRNWTGPWSSPYAAVPIAYHLNDVSIPARIIRTARRYSL